MFVSSLVISVPLVPHLEYTFPKTNQPGTATGCQGMDWFSGLPSLGFGQSGGHQGFVISSFLLVLLIQIVFILVVEDFNLKFVKFDFEGAI